MKVTDRTDSPTGAINPATLIAGWSEHTAAVTALAFSPDRGLLASADRDGSGRIWDIASKKPAVRGVVRQHGDPFSALTFAPNGRLLAAGSGAPDGLIRLYDVTEKAPREVGVLRGTRGPVQALAFSPDSRLVAGGGGDRTLRLWEVTTTPRADARTLLSGHSGPIAAVTFAPDGRGAATAGQDGTARVWAITSLRSWERAALLHGGEVEAVAYSPDGKTVATACKGGPVRLWDLTSVRPAVRTEFGGPVAGVGLLVFTADSAALVGVGEGPRVVNWDLRTGRPARVWDVPGGPASAVTLTRDGRYLARGSASGTVEIYRVAEKRS